MRNYLTELNKDQYDAVINFVGPSFVIAGPGAGKTRVITYRVAYMIDCGIAPDSIILFTFTKKAANELKERVVDMVGRKGKDIMIGTYHSVCSRFLRRYSHYLGYDSNYSIYDADDSKKVLKKIIKSEYNIDSSMVINKIEFWKRNMIDYKNAIQLSETDIEKKVANYYKEYQIQLKKNNAMDFNDLIFNMVTLLRNNHDVQTQITNQYKYIISDESQDSNNIDFELVKLLGNGNNNICFVLDEEQSIYGFRGANFDTVMNLMDSDEFKIHQLKQNYRSTKTIVNASRSLVEHNTRRKEKTIFTNNSVGPKIIYYHEYNETAEASRVTRIVKALHKKSNIPYSDIAILYRTNKLSKPIEKTFVKNNIPYRIINGTSFADRMEIKDIMAYLKFASNPYDAVSFKRIINVPKRKLGEKSIKKILDVAEDNKYGKIDNNRINILELCKQTKLAPSSQKGLNDFIEIIEKIQASNNCQQDIDDLIKKVVKKTGYISYLEQFDNPQERKANITELIEIANHYETLEELLESILINNCDDLELDEESDTINLLTMHSSKGLEYKAIIIIGANEGIVPHSRALTTNEIEEERRLMYVAMTRAKKYLFITSHKYSNYNNIMSCSDESRFLSEIDNEYMIRLNSKVLQNII